ncbi:unnamed protein product [Cuscuta campestris]|uniref:RRM domain-containing protein n=1 Tax=Cuscuta campestris TaxID=132261 RepID=A0A484LQW0_9ASTE|nr:unnamed protein product [Cuscuta campestris]
MAIMTTNLDDANTGRGGAGNQKPAAATFGDTTLTKVFVGGLAWETPKEALSDHFHKFGEILEAVIISNKLTGRSKGYGFVTFKEAEAAKKACEDAAPMIHGRRANCNLASLGARRPRPPPQSSASPPPPQGPHVVVGPGAAAHPTSPANHVRLIYPVAAPPAAGIGALPPPYYHHNQYRQALPLYGFRPTYVATDLSFNHKVSYGGGAYFYPSGQQPHMVAAGGGGGGGANAFVPAAVSYGPLYQYSHHPETLGLPAHVYYPTTVGPFPTVPAPLFSKAPTAVGNVGGGVKMVVKGN